jgi:beta-catenin-like protein 1
LADSNQLENSIFELLVSNLKRLDETEDADRQGVFQILGLLENLLSFMPPLADQVGSSTDIVAWLVARMQQKAHDSNRQYSSEMLSILLQNSPANVDQLLDAKGMDALLMILSVSCLHLSHADPTGVPPA